MSGTSRSATATPRAVHVAASSPVGRLGRPRRATARAAAILDLLEHTDRPLSALRVHDLLRGGALAPSLTTIYRLLPLLVDEGLLHVFRVDDEAAYLACTPEAHDHLICLSCGRVQPQPIELLRPWLDDIARQGFTVQDYRADVYGTCARCAAPPAQPTPPVTVRAAHR